ncbi:hypothetical protein CA830_24260 [Burkholderia multivorans]|nr:hypothetical protein CA830_24260 [Burkholderia multivorans]OXH89258.1 hypothetical protein CA831_14520 [Burkholderia multivorans]
MYLRPDVSVSGRIISFWRHTGLPCRGRPSPSRYAIAIADSSPSGDVSRRIVRHWPAQARPATPEPRPAAHCGRWHETCTNLSRSAAHRPTEQQPKQLGDFPCLS